MSVLPSPGSRLGTLRLGPVLDYYDGPLLFVVRNELGYAFLAIATDTDDSGDVFVYVPMSEHRLASVRTGLLSLRRALVEAETDTLFVVRPHAETPVEEIARTRIPEEWLPAERITLNERLETTFAFSAQEFSQLARIRGFVNPHVTENPHPQPAPVRLCKCGHGLSDHHDFGLCTGLLPTLVPAICACEEWRPRG